jgi:hypothetical protein
MGPTFGFLGVPVIWLAFMFFLLITAAFGGLQSFSVPVLGGIYGISAAAAVAALTGYLLGSAAGMVVGGFVAVRVHRMIAPWAARWSAPPSLPRCWPAACCRPGA